MKAFIRIAWTVSAFRNGFRVRRVTDQAGELRLLAAIGGA